jgi:hypothetical protein
MALDNARPRSRRALLIGAIGGAAALAAQALGRPLTVRAANGDPLTAGHSFTATSTTGVTTTGGNGLQGYSSDAISSGLYGENTAGGYGLAARSNSTAAGGNAGVYAQNTSTGDAIHAYAGDGHAIFASSENGWGVKASSTNADGVLGLTSGAARAGVRGVGQGGTGVIGYASYAGGPTSTGVVGYSGLSDVPASILDTGVLGVADRTAAAVGVRGSSPVGRGALFAGKAAQVKLKPSSAVTHPTSGQRGDLFVDASGRLWFCKGGTTWKQLA